MKSFIYVSGWKEHGGKPGLGLHILDEETGEISFVKMLDEENSFNATYLDREKNILYINNETVELPEEFTGGGGRIFAYRINENTGELQKLSETKTFCPNPTWLQKDADQTHLLVANHSGFGTATKIVKKDDGTFDYELIFDDAALEVFELEEDGCIGILKDVTLHDMRVKGRALHSHPHCIVPVPGHRDWYVVNDKGECRVYMYKLTEDKKLVKLSQPVQLPEGSAPRYCVFHPIKPYFYINQERNMDMCCFKYDQEGNITLMGTASTLLASHQKQEGVMYEQQGLAISEDGSHVYSVLNGPNSVAVFTVDEATGMLILQENIPVDGKWPRAIAFSKNRKFMIVGCLNSGDIYTYQVMGDGGLKSTGFKANQKGASYITVY